MSKEIDDKKYEQEHLDHVMGMIKDREKKLRKSIKTVEGEAEILILISLMTLSLTMMAIQHQWKRLCPFTSNNNF